MFVTSLVWWSGGGVKTNKLSFSGSKIPNEKLFPSAKVISFMKNNVENMC